MALVPDKLIQPINRVWSGLPRATLKLKEENDQSLKLKLQAQDVFYSGYFAGQLRERKSDYAFQRN